MINKHLIRLWAGYNSKFYDLPARLVDLQKLAEQLPFPGVPEPRVAHVEDLADDAAEALIAGKPVPTDVGEMVVASREAHDAWALENHYRAELSRRLETKITDLVMSSADEVIAGLQPSFRKIVGDFSKVAKVLPMDVSAAQILAADNPKMRTAWQTLTDLSSRYYAIRGAWSVFPQHPEWDVLGQFAEVENLVEVWPGSDPTRRMHRGMAENTPPWPAGDPPARLLWLQHRGARFILPTVAERDALWWRAYGSGVEQQRANAWNVEAARGMGSSGTGAERAVRHPSEVIAGRSAGDAA